MNANAVRERELRLSELFAIATRVWRDRLGIVIAIVASINVPIEVVRALWISVFNPSQPLRYLGLSLLSIVGLVASIAIVTLTDGAIAKRRIRFNQILKQSFERFLPVLQTFVILIVTVLVGTIFLIFPGIYFLTIYGLSVYVAAIRDSVGFDALVESKDLVTNQRLKVFIFGFVIFAIPAIANDLISTLLEPFLEIAWISIVQRTIVTFVVDFALIIHTIFFLNVEAISKLELEVK